MKPTDFARRADAVITGAAGDSKADDLLELPLLRGERFAGRFLTRIVVSMGLLTTLVAASAAALAWLGVWEPLVALMTLVVLAALSWRVSAIVPTRALPLWSALALLVISMGATTWAGLTHDEQVLPRSEAGLNAQTSIALAQRHEWPISLSANQFGGKQVLRIPGVTINSQGFRQVGSAAEPLIEPLALMGTPAWLSVGYWAGGVGAMLWVPALFGGLAVLAIGLLASSVVGPRWGPFGALSAAICFPVLHAARTTSPDIVVLFLLCAGLLLLVAATRTGARGHWQQARPVGFLAGAVVAGGSFFGSDALGHGALLLPVAALLVIRRDGAGAPALWGAGVTTALAALSGVVLSGGLLREQQGSLIPLGLLLVGCSLLAALMVASARRGARVPDGIRTVLPRLLAASTMIGGLALVALPSRQGLVWTSWWTGPYALSITVVVAAVAAHHLTQAWVRDQPLPAWTGALAVGLAATVLGWLPPSGARTTPWVSGGSGGMVMALPLVIVCVAAGAAGVTRWSRRRLTPVVVVAVSVGIVAALLVPEAISIWPHAVERVSQGQVAAVQQVCRVFGPGDVVLMVDDRAADEWLPTVRANCDVPALSLTSATRADPDAAATAVASVAQAVNARGGRLVVMAGGSVAVLSGLAGGTTRIGVPIAAVNGLVTQDARPVAGRPDGLSSFPVQVWLAAVG